MVRKYEQVCQIFTLHNLNKIKIGGKCYECDTQVKTKRKWFLKYLLQKNDKGTDHFNVIAKSDWRDKAAKYSVHRIILV